VNLHSVVSAVKVSARLDFPVFADYISNVTPNHCHATVGTLPTARFGK
jgi:hypothetical protein